MKKLFVFLAVLGFISLASAQIVAAQDEPATNQTEQTEEIAIHQAIKTKFIEGGPGFMATILLCFVMGLAIVIERIIYLSLSATNVEKLLGRVDNALSEPDGVNRALEICKNTRGPVASIFTQGLMRYDQGLDAVEKSITSYGGVQMSLMEKNLSWIQLFIAIAPSLGFMGTVIGMIGAFDAIQAMGDISPNVVAGGIKVALITTVGGLIVAVILQLFYNYLVSKIDSLTISMEDASISFIDVLVKHQN